MKLLKQWSPRNFNFPKKCYPRRKLRLELYCQLEVGMSQVPRKRFHTVLTTYQTTEAWSLDNDDGLGHTLFGTAQLCTHLALYFNLSLVLQL